MQRISSRTTRFYKWMFPVMWFGFLVFFIVTMLATPKRGSVPDFIVIFPLLMAAFGYFLMKKLLWDLADQVVDAGDALIVRFGHKEERIPLANITNVSYQYMMSPPRVTLTLRSPGNFGKEVSFAAPVTFIPLTKNPQIVELMERVDAARLSAKT